MVLVPLRTLARWKMCFAEAIDVCGKTFATSRLLSFLTSPPPPPPPRRVLPFLRLPMVCVFAQFTNTPRGCGPHVNHKDGEVDAEWLVYVDTEHHDHVYLLADWLIKLGRFGLVVMS